MTKHNRRDFFKLTSLALAGSVLPGSAAKAQERILKAAGGLAPNQKIRIGLVGCGGRGTGAANQAMNADPNVELVRSEEHTSELQSRGHLVCRLLLEKKKKHARERGRQ